MLKPKGTSQCTCDCQIDTCSDCFVRGYTKPWCENCKTNFNDGKCNCDKPKPYVRKGWADNTKRIVKHTDKEKETIYEWFKQHNKILENAINSGRKIRYVRKCDDCGKEFGTRGKYNDDYCKDCMLKIINETEWT